jgi:uncharacterized lipoprotein
MQTTVKYSISAALLTAILISCGTTEEVHYRDTSMLEKPPTITADRPAGVQEEVEPGGDEPEDAENGLGTKVYMADSNPPLLIIKQPFDQVWSTLAQALTQQDIQVVDRNRELRAYYVTYDPDNYHAGSLFSFFRDDYAEEDYLLKLETRAGATAISVEAVDHPRPGRASDDDKPTDGAERLLKSLHETLRDDLIEK